MGFGNLGFGEILAILIVVLLLFGAKRIPEIAGSFGKGIREFKKSLNDVQNTVQSEVQSSRDDREHLRAPAPRAEANEAQPEPKRLIQ